MLSYTRRMTGVVKFLLVFQKSNTYRTLHGIYEELGAFGTAGSIILPDPRTAIHHYPLTVGEYAVAQDYQGRVNTLYREFQKTVGEVVKELSAKVGENIVIQKIHRFEIGS